MEDPALYRSIEGPVQYITVSRPEIGYSVNKVCQFMAQPFADSLEGSQKDFKVSQALYLLGYISSQHLSQLPTVFLHPVMQTGPLMLMTEGPLLDHVHFLDSILYPGDPRRNP